MSITSTDLIEALSDLDRPCWQCEGKGEFVGEECDVCYATGYQATTAGVLILRFLRRQRKRIEREDG